MATKPICKIEGCDKPACNGRGWCAAHYARWRNHGDPLGGGRPRIGGFCSVDGCEKPVEARGWCQAHYKRWRLYGDPLHGGELGTTRGEVARFLNETVLLYRDHDCLIWPYNRDQRGYARIGRGDLVHRRVCEEVHGLSPTPEHEVAHSCGKGHEGCVNPMHLRWATHSENQMDRVIHGTSNRGPRHGISKLTEDNVRHIRKLKGVKTQREIAVMFGVSFQLISSIHRGKLWEWVT